MGTTADLIKSAAQAMSSGQTLDSDALGTEETSSAGMEDPNTVRSEESTDGESEISPFGLEEDQNGSSDEQASSDPVETSASTKESITVTDASGKKRKVEIDYSDREATKKAYQIMYGARKWQYERDQVIKASKEKDAQLSELKSNWDALEEAYRTKGNAGIIDLLDGHNGGYKAWEKQLVERAIAYHDASPSERAAMERDEMSRKRELELEAIRQENEKFRKQMLETSQQAELRAIESRISPVFDKYRFADKLGDPRDEHLFDKMLWNTALENLEAFEESGVDITTELAEREFRKVAQALRKRIGVQAEKKANRVIAQKKQEATEKVQSQVSSGHRSNSSSKEIQDMLNKGDTLGLFKNWRRLTGGR